MEMVSRGIIGLPPAADGSALLAASMHDACQCMSLRVTLTSNSCVVRLLQDWHALISVVLSRLY